jgi:hypothetical protein
VAAESGPHTVPVGEVTAGARDRHVVVLRRGLPPFRPPGRRDQQDLPVGDRAGLTVPEPPR